MRRSWAEQQTCEKCRWRNSGRKEWKITDICLKGQGLHTGLPKGWRTPAQTWLFAAGHAKDVCYKHPALSGAPVDQLAADGSADGKEGIENSRHEPVSVPPSTHTWPRHFVLP